MLGILNDELLLALCACRFGTSLGHMPLVICFVLKTSIGCNLPPPLVAFPVWRTMVKCAPGCYLCLFVPLVATNCVILHVLGVVVSLKCYTTTRYGASHRIGKAMREETTFKILCLSSLCKIVFDDLHAREDIFAAAVVVAAHMLPCLQLETGFFVSAARRMLVLVIMRCVIFLNSGQSLPGMVLSAPSLS